MRSDRNLIVCLHFLIPLALVACGTQQVQPPKDQAPDMPAVCAPVTSDAPEAVQKKTDYRQVSVMVRDSTGREVRNLGKNDFLVKRGDALLNVQFARWDPKGPLSIVIVADTSGSTLSKLPQTKEAVRQIVNSLDPRDDVALFAFSGRPFMIQPFTSDHQRVEAREQLFHAYGPTSLYDSLITASAVTRKGCYPKHLMVLITDGLDNTSQHSLKDAVATLTKAGVTTYAIAIGNLSASPASTNQIGAIFSNRDEDTVDESLLGHLTEPTGGATFRVAEIADQDLLAAAAKTINEKSRGEYVVGFIDTAQNDPTPVSVRIRNHPDYRMSGSAGTFAQHETTGF